MEHNDDNRSIVMAEIMSPDKANFSGHVHGGYIMQLLDRVAYACASRYASKYMVTLSVDQILFKEPVYVGELVTFYASVNYVGNSSLEVGIRVEAESLTSQVKRHTNTCYFTMVAVDKTSGKPIPINKPLIIRNEEERYRLEEAKIRKTLRMEYIKQHEEHKAAVRGK
jgi:acyl-CoA hydrolase